MQDKSMQYYQAKELRAFARQQRIWKQYCEARKRVDSKFNECLKIKQESIDIRDELRRVRNSMRHSSGSSGNSKHREIAEIQRRFDEKEEQFQRANSELTFLARERDELREKFRNAENIYIAVMREAPQNNIASES